MKVQQSAEVQINEIKSNGIKNRNHLSFNLNGGIGEHVMQEIIKEYDLKIQKLEMQVKNNQQVQQLTDQVSILQTERDRLIKAVELLGDRSFFTK